MLLTSELISDHRTKIQKGKISADTQIYKSKGFRRFILELFINLIQCPPGIDGTFVIAQLDKKIKLSWDTILVSIMYIRIYLIFRFYGQISKWRSKRAIKYCEMEGCEANTEFAVKSVLKKSPLVALFYALIGSSVVFGTVLVNFENPMNEGQGGSGQDFTFIWNGMWLSVVTMTTGKLLSNIYK